MKVLSNIFVSLLCLVYGIISGVVTVLAVSQWTPPCSYSFPDIQPERHQSLLLSVVLEPPAPHQPRSQDKPTLKSELDIVHKYLLNNHQVNEREADCGKVSS